MGNPDAGDVLDGFSKTLKDKFKGAFRAVSEKAPFDFYAVAKVIDVNGERVLQLFPSPQKEFRLKVTVVEEDGDDLLVTTEDDRWSFRPVPEENRKAFIKIMRAEGVDG